MRAARARLSGRDVAATLKKAGHRPFVPRTTAIAAIRHGRSSPRTEISGSFLVQAPIYSDAILVRAMRTHDRSHREEVLEAMRRSLMDAGATNITIRWVDDPSPAAPHDPPIRHRVLVVPRDQPEAAKPKRQASPRKAAK